MGGLKINGFVRLAALALPPPCSLTSAGDARGQGKNNEQQIRELIGKFKMDDHNYCVGVFKELRDFGNEVVPTGLEIYKTSASDRQKERIVLLLGGLQDERAVAFLIERLQKSDYAARSALWDTGAFAAPAVRKVLKSPDKWPRDQAAVMLVKWGSREGLPVLLEGLKNETEDFKYSGVPDGFSLMGEESIPHLTGALQDKDARIRENAKYTLNHMGRGGFVYIEDNNVWLGYPGRDGAGRSSSHGTPNRTASISASWYGRRIPDL